MIKKQPDFVSILDEIIIEVIAKSKDKTFIFDIKAKDFFSMERKNGFTYQAYQKGFSSFKDAVRMEYYKQK